MELQKIFKRIISSGKYLPEIDGLRFLAIIWVVIFHSRHAFIHNPSFKMLDDIKDYYFVNKIFENGFQGVELFFVISGFILTLPFAKHYLHNEKKVNLKAYFYKRLTRLEPPYIIAMCFFFVILIIKGDFKFMELLPSLGASLIYMHNIIYKTYPYITMVAWSLEIEVQFYILAPILTLILILPVFYRRIILILMMFVFPILQWYFPLKILTIYTFIEFFLAGILLADIYLTVDKPKFNRYIISIIGFVLFYLILFTNHEDSLFNAIFYPFIILIFYYISIIDSIWNSIFKIRVISLIGGMCYSIYLLHFPFIALLSKFSQYYNFSNYILPTLIINSIVVIFFTLIISSVYYLLIERPCMDKDWPQKLIAYLKNKLF